MNDELITALLEKKAFEHTTIVTARYTSVDLFGRIFEKRGNFKVRKVIRSANRTMFELITLADGNTLVMTPAQNIELVDGMDPCRYADIYDLLPDGSSKKVGRKRGRKPKSLLSA